MNKKEPTGHFIPSSGFLNDGIKKWKPKEPPKDFFKLMRDDLAKVIKTGVIKPKESTPSISNMRWDSDGKIIVDALGNKIPKESTDNYVLSADGYCLNPKKLIEKFLVDLYALRKGTKEDSFERYIINESIEKWEKELER